MRYLPLIDIEHVAFRHGVGDTNSHKNEAILPCVGAVGLGEGGELPPIGGEKKRRGEEKERGRKRGRRKTRGRRSNL